MKASELLYPHTWEEREPHLEGKVLFVPEHYYEHDCFEKRPFFDNDHPISVEFCSGNGWWIIKKAMEDPSRNWIAVEKQFKRVRKIHSKMVNRGLDNLLIVAGEAQPFARHYLEEGSIDTIYVNFPDPWPKDRHAKHRLIQAPFTGDLARIVRPGGEAILVTDDLPYHKQMVQVFDEDPGFTQALYSTSWENYGSSFFEKLWRDRGRTIHYLKYDRT